jgi:hypothetical protein
VSGDKIHRMNKTDNQITSVNITSVNPIAIKLSALKELSAHIPPSTHEFWGKVTCDCGEEFNLYGNIKFSRPDEHQKYVDNVTAHLKKEDTANKPHRKIYDCDLQFLDRVFTIPV